MMKESAKDWFISYYETCAVAALALHLLSLADPPIYLTKYNMLNEIAIADANSKPYVCI